MAMLGVQTMAAIDNNMNQMTVGLEEVHLQPAVNSKLRRKDDNINKLFDQSKRKINSLDSQRIIGVLEDLIKRIEVITLLPFLVENLKRYSVMLGSDLCISIQEYDEIQLAYSTCCSNMRKVKQQLSRLNLKGHESPNLIDEPLDEMQQKISSLSKRLSDVIRTIMRLFKLNPTAMETIKGEHKERTSETNTCISQLNLLQEMIFNRLVTSPNEEIEKHKLTVQMMNREKKAQTLIKKLEVELKQSRKSKEDLIYEKNEQIRKLKSNISGIEQETDLANRKLVSDAQKVEVAEIKNSDGRKAKLQQEVIQLKQRLQSQVSTHKETELTLRKRKYKIETEVENWIQKYDNEMGEKQDTIDELTELYNEEKRQLKDLETRFETLERQYVEIMEERRIAEEKREAAEKELRVMVRAATLLQAIWRAYRCRKALKQKQKGKGKKGKGKKKK